MNNQIYVPSSQPFEPIRRQFQLPWTRTQPGSPQQLRVDYMKQSHNFTNIH